MHFNLKQFEQAVMFTAPLLLPAFGVPVAVVNLGIHAIVAAENAANGSPKTGAEKKAIALDIVKSGLEGVNAVKPGTIDVAEVLGAVDQGIDATVQAVHAAKDIPVKGV